MIRHTVAFRLKHAAGSSEEQSFLTAGRQLATIAGVRNFECLRQVSPKSRFMFGFSMEFATPADYEFYNQHPMHIEFVRRRWLVEVEDFQELDYQPVPT
jgi:hypothetical protein